MIKRLENSTLAVITAALIVTLLSVSADAAPAAANSTEAAARTYAQSVAGLRTCTQLGGALTTPPDATQLLKTVFARSSFRKDEFETTEQYKERIAALLREGLGGTDTVVVRKRLKQYNFEYDADAGLMKARLLFVGLVKDSPLPGSAHLKLEDTFDIGKGYTGSNSFGVTKDVTKGYVHELTISFDKAYFGTTGRVSDWSIPMDPVAARALKQSAEMFLLGRVVPPYVHTAGTLMKPTLDSPVDGMIFHNELFVEPFCVALISGSRVVHTFIDRADGGGVAAPAGPE